LSELFIAWHEPTQLCVVLSDAHSSQTYSATSSSGARGGAQQLDSVQTVIELG